MGVYALQCQVGMHLWLCTRQARFSFRDEYLKGKA
jgi:hypothetical protein